MKKKLVITGAITLLVSTSMAIGAYAESNLETISAYLNHGLHLKLQGKDWQAKDADSTILEPITYKGSTYLPVRAIGEAFKVKIGYDAETNTVMLGDSVPTASSSRSNPTAIGTKLHYTNEGIVNSYEGDVSVDQIIRGDNAWTMIKSANQFNDAPATGKEYILASVTASVTRNSKPDASVDLSGYNFTLVSSTGKDYEKAMVVTPDPSFETKLYAGASHTGWVVFIVDKNDAAPVITFARNYDGSGGVWFKTVK